LARTCTRRATSLGLAPCGIGAYFDDDINRLLGVDGRDEAVVYLLAIGAREPSAMFWADYLDNQPD